MKLLALAFAAAVLPLGTAFAADHAPALGTPITPAEMGSARGGFLAALSPQPLPPGFRVEAKPSGVGPLPVITLPGTVAVEYPPQPQPPDVLPQPSSILKPILSGPLNILPGTVAVAFPQPGFRMR